MDTVVSGTESAFPIPVVRLIISDTRGRVLLLRRQGIGYATGSWCLPGGKVDYGDTVELTVKKELAEETALECRSVRFLFFQDSLPATAGRMHCINLYFECAVSGTIRLNEESSEFAWVGLEQMGEYDIAFRNDEGLKMYWEGRQR